jgi:hypothetical protein
MQNKRNFVLLAGGSLLVLVVFFLIGLKLFTNSIDTPSLDIPAVTSEEKELTPEEEAALQEEIAVLIKVGELAGCDQIQDDMYRKVCINNIALNRAKETNDIAYCQHIDNELIPRADCERQVVSTLSLENEDQTICDQATDETVKTQCKESYQLAIATKKDDVTSCAQATNPDMCIDTFYFQKFMQSSDLVSCDSFSTLEARTDCASLKEVGSDQIAFLQFCEKEKTSVFAFFCQTIGTEMWNLKNSQASN